METQQQITCKDNSDLDNVYGSYDTIINVELSKKKPSSQAKKQIDSVMQKEEKADDNIEI